MSSPLDRQAGIEAVTFLAQDGLRRRSATISAVSGEDEELSRMRAIGGSGALLSGGQEVPVRYDLVEAAGANGVFAEGKVFGDTHALYIVFNTGPCVLRLESGEPLHAFLEDCRSSNGVADIRVTDPIAWP